MKTSRRCSQIGLSLIELMVAMAIGLFLMAGAVTIFANSKRTYVEQEDASRIQENLRFAMETLARDIRMAGYFGCGYNLDRTRLSNDLSPSANSLLDTSSGGLEGVEGSATTPSWLPSGNTTDVISSRVSGTDAITVRHAGGPTWEVTADFTASQSVPFKNSATSYVADTTYNQNNANIMFGGDGQAVQANDIVAVGGCGAIDIFKASAVGTSGTTNTISHSAALSSDFNETAKVTKVTFVRYYIATDSTTGEPALFRQYYDRSNGASGGLSTQMLVPGIENMQITYGVDDNNDDTVDRYVTAGTSGVTDGSATSWRNVVAVRIGLLARSAVANAPETDSQTYTLNGTTIAAANDHRKRRMLETTIFVRNNVVNVDRI